tara:strand:- start:160 stop:294 length:135 start_codon:yes stop_codon:yes gene_type:complete
MDKTKKTDKEIPDWINKIINDDALRRIEQHINSRSNKQSNKKLK